MTKPWQAYENAARSVLQQIGSVLGVVSVEGKQTLDGNSGTQWEIDAKAIQENGERFLVVEARRYTKNSLKQEDIAALAFRICDIGAAGGVVVSPLPLQRGAELIAKSAAIEHLRLSADSTATDYLAEYMERRFIGISVFESVSLTDSCDAVIIRG